MKGLPKTKQQLKSRVRRRIMHVLRGDSSSLALRLPAMLLVLDRSIKKLNALEKSDMNNRTKLSGKQKNRSKKIRKLVAHVRPSVTHEAMPPAPSSEYVLDRIAQQRHTDLLLSIAMFAVMVPLIGVCVFCFPESPNFLWLVVLGVWLVFGVIAIFLFPFQCPSCNASLSGRGIQAQWDAAKPEVLLLRRGIRQEPPGREWSRCKLSHRFTYASPCLPVRARESAGFRQCRIPAQTA
jgi:hypothetical protein